MAAGVVEVMVVVSGLSDEVVVYSEDVISASVGAPEVSADSSGIVVACVSDVRAADVSEVVAASDADDVL